MAQNKNLLSYILTVKSIDTLNPTELANILNFMMRHEKSPGGPYLFNSSNDTEANRHIADLFLQQGVRLEGALKYGRVSAEPDIEKHPMKHSANTTSSSSTKLTKPWQRQLTQIKAMFPQYAVEAARPLLRKLASTDSAGEISRLTTYFASSLKISINMSKNALDTFSKANCDAWLAYSIYDQIVDDKSLTELAPVANFFSRSALTQYSDQTDNSVIANNLFTLVDTANAFEVVERSAITIDTTNNTITLNRPLATASLASNLPHRSIIHITGPLIIARRVVSSAENLESIQRALEGYCGARQLLDDIHDWKDDLLSGRQTYVTASIIQSSKLPLGTSSLTTTTKLFEQHFYQSVLPEMLDTIDHMLTTTVDTLTSSILKDNSIFVRQIIAPLQHTSRQARKQHTFEKQLLVAYTETVVNYKT